MIINIFRSLVILAVFFTGASFSFDDITFYNVGQGHCVVAYSKTKGILVIDAGSSSTVGIDGVKGDGKCAILAQMICQDIRSKIATYFEDDKKASSGSGTSDAPLDFTDSLFDNGIPISFIITHADQDHLNLVKPIVEDLLSPQERFDKKAKLSGHVQLKANFILGGYEAAYKKGPSTELLALISSYDRAYGEHFKKSKDLLWTPIWTSPSKDFKFDLGNNEIEFISVKNDKKRMQIGKARTPMDDDSDDTNASSIVVRIKSLFKYSVMITGDKTTSQILTILNLYKQEQRFDFLKSDVLLATHHGSEVDFNSEWMAAVNPYYLVVSCGTSSYDHPRPIAVCSPQVLYNLRYVADTPWHPIRACGTLSDITFLENNHKPIFPISSGFRLSGEKNNKVIYSYSMTKAGVYVTADQGTINFSFSERGIKVTPSKREGHIDLRQAFYQFLTSYSDKRFADSDITWSQLVFPSFDDFLLRDYEVVYKNCPELQELYLDSLTASDKDSDALCEVIKSLRTLRVMNLPKNRLSDKGREKIYQAWNHRGLNIGNPMPETDSSSSSSSSTTTSTTTASTVTTVTTTTTATIGAR